MIYIDADGCPVVKQTVKVAKRYGVGVVIICDFSHEFNIENVDIIYVTKGADSADYAIANRVKKNDMVITQDYGLATMVLSKGAYAMNQDGRMYDDKNIDMLLDMRYLSAKARRAGMRTKGPKPRSEQQNEAFVQSLTKWISEFCKKGSE